MLGRLAVILALVALAALLAGCGGGGGGGGSSEVGEASDYTPLKVGNQWTYLFTDYAMTAGKAAMSTRGLLRPKQVSAQATQTIVDTQQIGGSVWYQSLFTYSSESEQVIRYVRHATQGMLVKTSVDAEPYYALRNALEVGRTWGVPYDANVELRIIAVGETIDVNGVTYPDCVLVTDSLIQSGQPSDVITTWYAKQVGLVREERRLDGELDYTMELLSHLLVD